MGGGGSHSVKNGQKIKASKHIIHPKYVRNVCYFDIGLIKLKLKRNSN
jgi:hypothetical protein